MEAKRGRMDTDSLDITHSKSELLLVQTHGAEWMGRAERRGGVPGGAELTACTSQKVNCLQNNRFGSGLCNTRD